METASKKLKERWYKKLKDSGFIDIENADGTLKAEVHPRTIANALQTKETRQTYYRMAEEFLSQHKNFTPEQRKIWALHCTGLGATRISRTLGISICRADNTISKFKRLARLGRK